MSGTRAGGIKARNTNYKNHGEDFYKRIGKIGGQNGNTGGFASNPGLARTAGAKGGAKSKRGLSKERQEIYAVLDTRIAELREMRLLGATWAKIAQEFDLPVKTVRAWASRRRSDNE